ncbi:MAG TPA: amidohydrolase family protein [Blastocatellia bacterium]
MNAEPADVIYTDGVIVTVNDAQPSAEAVAVKEGKILAVGAYDEVMRHLGATTEIVSLKGRTMIPGFVDGHSHICDYGMLWGYPTLGPPPAGDVKNIDDLIAAMRGFIEEKKIPRGVAVFGHGYDDLTLAERRHPTREDLDRVSTEHPVVVIHASAHAGSANTLALENLGFVKGAPDPKGGRVQRDERTGDPTGVVEEQAVFNLLQLLPSRTYDDRSGRQGSAKTWQKGSSPGDGACADGARRSTRPDERARRDSEFLQRAHVLLGRLVY